MKRINSITKRPFARWDTNECGQIFWCYRPKKRKSDGYFVEYWKHPDDIPYSKPSPKKKIVKNPPRRTNPDTGKMFVRWDKDKETGKVFWNYEDKKPISEGDYCYELWLDEEKLPYPEPVEPEITYLKQCSICANWKIRHTDFYKRSRSFDGRESQCKKCTDNKNSKWREDNPTKFKELVDRRYAENKESITEEMRTRYANNPALRKRKLIDYYNREKRTKRATPSWITKKDLLPFYLEAQKKTEETGVPHHVDHIVPLKHKRVCGLNVPANLRVITAEENLKKSNKWQ